MDAQCTVAGNVYSMGSKYQVYLTDEEAAALLLLREKRVIAGRNGTANAVFKEAVRAAMIEEGVAKYVPGMGPGQPALFRVVPQEPIVQEPEVVEEPAPRRRRRMAR